MGLIPVFLGQPAENLCFGSSVVFSKYARLNLKYVLSMAFGALLTSSVKTVQTKGDILTY